MENLVPAAPALDLQYLTRENDVTIVHVNALNAIRIGDIPTAEQVSMETHRLLQIQRVQEMSGGTGMDSDEYSESMVRHQKVIYAKGEMGQPAILGNQIQALGNQIQAMANQNQTQIQALTNQIQTLANQNQALTNQIQQIQDSLPQHLAPITHQIHQVIERLNIMDARLNANSAKSSNSLLNPSVGSHIPYATVVKYTPGHPWIDPPAIHGIQFAPEYVVNTPPPENLVPLNYNELQLLAGGRLDQLRRRLRAIFWFYNDPRLQLEDNANKIACQQGVVSLDNFLKYP